MTAMSMFLPDLPWTESAGLTRGKGPTAGGDVRHATSTALHGRGTAQEPRYVPFHLPLVTCLSVPELLYIIE